MRLLSSPWVLDRNLQRDEPAPGSRAGRGRGGFPRINEPARCYFRPKLFELFLDVLLVIIWVWSRTPAQPAPTADQQHGDEDDADYDRRIAEAIAPEPRNPAPDWRARPAADAHIGMGHATNTYRRIAPAAREGCISIGVSCAIHSRSFERWEQPKQKIPLAGVELQPVDRSVERVRGAPDRAAPRNRADSFARVGELGL
jgi:hypothetical protein